MATKKSDSPAMKAGDLLSDVFHRSIEIIQDLALATTTASVDASIASTRRLVKLQHGGVKAGLNLISKVQKYTEKSFKEAAREGKWLPREGKEVADEWSKMMKSGVDEFTRVTDKSFDLLMHFIDRIEKDQKSNASEKARKCVKPCSMASETVTPAPKTPVKPKRVVKKKSALKK